MFKWPVKISSLFNAPNGTKSSLDLINEIDIKKEDFGVADKAKVKGELLLYKMDNTIAALFSIESVDLKAVCCKCLCEFGASIDIPDFERVFFLSKPKPTEKIDDALMADMKNCEIDICQPIYQEILLHFSPNPVCFTGCKGLCSKCGQNLNKGKCNCDKQNINPQNPFTKLKNHF